MNKIKVLVIVTQMNCGGLENRLMDILRHIDSIQIDVYTNRMNEGYFDNEIRELGSRVYYSSPISIYNINNKVNEFKKFLLIHKEYKIVHSYMNEWSFIFCKGAYLAGVKTRIAHSRGANVRFNLASLIKRIIKFSIKKYATDYWAVSIPAAKYLFGTTLYNKGKIVILPNAINCLPYRYDNDKRLKFRYQNKLDRKFVILHVGNFTVPKNHKYLIRVFFEISKKEPLAKLLLVGGGDHSMIKKDVQHLQLEEKVFFLGQRFDVPNIMQGSDVFIFPSLHEGFPGAVLEAQAAGLPCLISDTITDEVCLLPTTKQLSITIEPNIWAEEALKLKAYERRDTYDAIIKSGYDIQNLIRKLTEFYENSAS